jgi:hypothetical protein
VWCPGENKIFATEFGSSTTAIPWDFCRFSHDFQYSMSTVNSGKAIPFNKLLFFFRYRSVPPVNSLILGTGAKPYVAFHYALDGGTTPPLQDVARAVANKIKSALPLVLIFSCFFKYIGATV